jgi:hypothetical protein
VSLGSHLEASGAEEEIGDHTVEIRRYPMLFHITQLHTPELCPKDEGGSKTLYDPKTEGVKLLAIYGAFAEHVIYYVVEANGLESVNNFLLPGLKRCTSKITPVSQVPIVK